MKTIFKKPAIFLLGLLMFLLLMLLTAQAQNHAAVFSDESKPVPVIMYHSILKAGGSRYIVTPEQLESDLKELQKRGYQTVLPRDVAAFAEGRGTLPEKPIILTFDDGHYNNMFYAYPLLQQYGMCACFNIVGAFSAFSTDSGDHSKPSYSHLTWEQLRELDESGIIEIGNHTYNMHKYEPRFGVLQKKGESDEAYYTNLINDIGRLQTVLEEKSGVKPVSFAYPFGKYCDASDLVLKELGFKIAFTCNEGTTLVGREEGACFLKMRRYNRESTYESAGLFDRIEKDIAKLVKK